MYRLVAFCSKSTNRRGNVTRARVGTLFGYSHFFHTITRVRFTPNSQSKSRLWPASSVPFVTAGAGTGYTVVTGGHRGATAREHVRPASVRAAGFPLSSRRARPTRFARDRRNTHRVRESERWPGGCVSYAPAAVGRLPSGGGEFGMRIVFYFLFYAAAAAAAAG